MNYILVITTFLFIIFGCTKEEVTVDCIGMSGNDNYITIPFKEKTITHSGYTIQFPNNYNGIGMTIQEWVSFKMVSSENTKFYYDYFCDVDCAIFFGNKLSSPLPNQIVHPSSNILLDEKIEFCINEEIESVLYCNNLTNASGVLFMKVNSKFYEALLVDFKIEKIDEVISIVKTIDKTE